MPVIIKKPYAGGEGQYGPPKKHTITAAEAKAMKDADPKKKIYGKKNAAGEMVFKEIETWQGAGGGPVPGELNINEIRLMAMFMCPIKDIALFFDLSERQFYRRLAQDDSLRLAFDKGRAQGRRMIRMKQFKVAVEDGDAAMLKWLGMNILGQSSRHTSVSEELNTKTLDDAIDTEFHEVFDRIDKEIADAEFTEEHSNGGKAVVVESAGPGQSGGADSGGADTVQEPG